MNIYQDSSTVAGSVPQGGAQSVAEAHLDQAHHQEEDENALGGKGSGIAGQGAQQTTKN